ncbi:carbohydrate ABC transporter permease [Cucumibacter marinus]|uniref:carbohydrate ABC transporter permease n=1 Tax=Cucumibacter marinus TaxID=1121252 RepID=UPI00040C9BA4|nr:sugar ABC transporter permease [Cucumibacter marinus]
MTAPQRLDAEKPGVAVPAKTLRTRVPLWWAIPGITLAFLYHYVATVAGGWYAFTTWDGLSDPVFIGLDNFIEIFSSPKSYGALINTVVLAFVFVAGVNLIGLALAVWLNANLKLRGFLRALFFATVVMNPLATSYIWSYLLAATGPINIVLGALGLHGLQKVWLGDPSVALMSVCLVMIWQYSGLTMVLYLSGLQTIPVELNEAAEVDGASAWRRFRKISLPLLMPAATVSITYTTITGLRVFDQVYALTRGGPNYSTETLATSIFKETFVYGRFGYGAALATVLTALILLISLVQILLLRLSDRRFQ